MPTPPMSGDRAVLSRRASPRGHSFISCKGGGHKSPSLLPHYGSPSGVLSPSAKKRKGSAGTAGKSATEDVLCPICDDVCTCLEVPSAAASGGASGWSSPIIIKDHAQAAAAKSKKKKPAKKAVVVKKPAAPVLAKKDLDKKADRVAQYVLSEYYFSQGFEDDASDGFSETDDHAEASEAALYSDYCGYDSDSSSLDELLFDLSDDSADEETALKMRELLRSKVTSVLGATAWIYSDTDEEESVEDFGSFYLFDPMDAANLVVNLPVHTPSLPASQGDAQQQNLANLTPQVLAAISAAAKTLSAATQHYNANPNTPYTREPAKHVQFVFEEAPVATQEQQASYQISLDEVIDTSRLHGSSPPTPSAAGLAPLEMKRWDRIPISSFRKRRLSVASVLPTNVIKQPPPEPPHSSFAALCISDIFTEDLAGSPHTASSSQPMCERRATVALAGDEFAAWRQSPHSDGTADYWPLGIEDGEEFYWLGEHFRTHA